MGASNIAAFAITAIAIIVLLASATVAVWFLARQQDY
jgi:hypothetical protein